MTMMRSRFQLLAATGTALLLAACGQKPAPVPVGAAATAAAPAAEIDAIAALLDRGEEGDAKRRIRALLRTSPNDPQAQLLRDSIERDPAELLGPASYPYVVKPGETMAGLAGRLLGNRLKAYQLARYNNIARPDTLAAGTTLRIPGEAPRPAPVRPEPRPAAPTPRPRPTPERPAAKPAPAPAPARPAANPAAAQRARAQGLAALNAGNVNNAVSLLRRAAALDPGNAVIARDLARAERIAATVRARR